MRYLAVVDDWPPERIREADTPQDAINQVLTGCSTDSLRRGVNVELYELTEPVARVRSCFDPAAPTERADIGYVYLQQRVTLPAP